MPTIESYISLQQFGLEGTLPLTYYQPVQYAQMRPQPKNGFGTTALVLGIVALVLGFIPFVSLFTAIPLGIIGGIFGILGIVRVSKRVATNKVASIFGLVASVLAVLLALASSITTGAFIGSLGSDQKDTQSAAQPAAEPAEDVQEMEPKTDQFPGQTEDDIVGKPGEEISTRGVKVTAEELRTVNDTFGAQLCSKVTIKNDGDSEVSYNAIDWKLQYPSGDMKDTTLSGEDPLSYGDIAPGGSADGNLCFDDTGEKGKYALISDDLFSFNSERAVWITER